MISCPSWVHSMYMRCKFEVKMGKSKWIDWKFVVPKTQIMKPFYASPINQNYWRFDIEDAFNRIGRVRDVWVARKPPGFAFVEMEDRRDAQVKVKILISKIPLCPSPSQVLLILTQDAVRELDGTRLCGNRCKVSPNYLTLPVKIQSWKVNFSGWDEQWRKRWKIREVSLKEPKEEESCQEEQVAQRSITASPFSSSISCLFLCVVNC